jgi:hypothetical protein
MTLRRGSCALIALALQIGATPAMASDAPMLLAPSSSVPPSPRLAGLFDLQLQLPEGRGLARLLLDAGVDEKDAASAARVAAGHLGDGSGGCTVKVALSRAAQGLGFSLQRLVLTTGAGQTIIERRAGSLTVVSGDTAPAKPARLS